MTTNPLLQVGRRLVIAHRGASGYAPENTLPAFQLAVEQGADAIELDVRVTHDGVPVVLHDATTARTTDSAVDVAASTADRLRVADAGARFSPDGGQTFPWRHRGVRIPTLAEVLHVTPDLPLLIEIKEPRGQGEVRRTLETHSAQHRVVVASADRHALAAFRDGGFSIGASRREIVLLYAAAWTGWTPRTMAYRVLSVPQSFHSLSVATPRFVAAANRRGCPVHVWTVDDPAAARRLWGDGVSGIVTNVPDVMRRVRETLPFKAGVAASP
ncbi:MAG: glycerophosphodiester phosphodiesterase [Gemmatimonadota bacterium]|nr:glycerophosphodiester phosphodiesterase [Gemmatimonadota bacterium]